MIKWRSEVRLISDLKPAGYNPRKLTEKQEKDLGESLERFDLCDPIVINLDGTIIGGHQRIRVLKSRGVLEVDVRVPDRQLSEAEEKELNLRLNKNLGEWDLELLASFDADMLKDVGFNSEELDKIFKLQESEKDEIVPNKQEQTNTQIGDVFELGPHRVMCGDSTSAEHFATLMGGGRADMVFTDPPYNVGYVGGMSAEGSQQRRKILNDKMSSEAFYNFLLAVFKSMMPHVDGAFYVCMSSSELHNLWAAFTDAGGHWQSYIIWAKDHFTLSRTDYQQQFEPIMVGTSETHDESDGEFIMYGWNKHFFVGGRRQGNVWHFDRPKSSDLHPTMKPVMLCVKAVVNSSPRGGLVLDAFLGSGTTLIACEKAERICYGMELDPLYVDVIVKRWEEFTGKRAVKLSQEAGECLIGR
jgi:DNA modification methylase